MSFHTDRALEFFSKAEWRHANGSDPSFFIGVATAALDRAGGRLESIGLTQERWFNVAGRYYTAVIPASPETQPAQNIYSKTTILEAKTPGGGKSFTPLTVRILALD